MALGAVLLDLDGTLWDGRAFYALVLDRVAGVDPTLTLERLARGDSVVRRAQAAGVSRARFADGCHQYIDDLRLYPGVDRSIAALLARGTRVGVVTNLPAWLATELLRRLADGNRLNPIVCYRRGLPPKPAPDLLMAATRQIPSETKGRIYYVGDQVSDARAAAAAGLPFAWASFGYERQEPAGTAVALGSFPDVLELD